MFYGQKLFPNFYTVLVGPTGLTRKTTAIRIGEHLVYDREGNPTDGTLLLPGISSAEGLLETIGGYNPKEEEPVDCTPTLLVIEEFASLLRKGKQESVANLAPMLTQMWDSANSIRLPTRKRPLIARNPFLSILAATTLEWLLTSITREEIMGGFGNRFLYFTAKPKDPIPMPVAPDYSSLEKLRADLIAIGAFWKGSPCIIRLSPKALPLWDRFYWSFMKADRPELLQDLSQRIPAYALKVSLVYAAIEKSKIIEPEHLLAGIELMKYYEYSLMELFGFFPGGDHAKLEARIFKILQDNPHGIKVWQLHRKLSGDVTGQLLHRILQGLAQVEAVELYTPADSGTKWVRPKKHLLSARGSFLDSSEAIWEKETQLERFKARVKSQTEDEDAGADCEAEDPDLKTDIV